MRTPIAFCGLALVLTLGSTADAVMPLQSNPVPGIGIIVKKHPPGGSHFGAPGLPAIPAGFFGPGSAPFSGIVGLQGQCSHNCGGCDNDCAGDVDDSRIDYVEDTDTGTLATAMAPMALYSTAPIEVAVNGVASFFDVFVEIRAPGPVPGAPIPGSLQLPPGVVLAPGTSSVVENGSCDVHARFTFADAATGAVVGQVIEADLHLVLQESSLRIAAIGEVHAHRLVLGSDGSTAVPFTYASAGGALIVQMKSLTEAPVGVEDASWGSLKSLFR
jgi:hypothetical protein